MISKEKVVSLPGEQWAPLNFEGRENRKQYAVSNKGRVLSYDRHPEEARLLSFKAEKNRPLKMRVLFGKAKKNFPIHILVAELFVPKKSAEQNHVIHLDRNSHNNVAENLRWATKEEAIRHVSARQDARSALKLWPGEVYKVIDIKTPHRNYAITNKGRLISFDKEVEQGIVMKTATHNLGYKIWRYKMGKQYRHQLVHRLVATYFIEKPSPEHDFVIHLDYNKTNNVVENLQWVTMQEQRKFSAQSEASKQNAKRLTHKSQKTGRGNKLTSEKVRFIKRILANEKRPKLKVLARQFGISTMQLHRIKTGENWGWLDDNTPPDTSTKP